MLKENVNILKDNILAVCAKYHQDASNITIVAATKTVEPQQINLLPDYGITIVGENRVQEYLQKRNAVKGLTWHIVGALQTNKVKYVVGNVALIQSVDRDNLALEIHKQSLKKQVISDVLIEVNIGNEPQKSGVTTEQLDRLLDTVYALSSIKVRGLMAVMPKDAPESLYEKMHKLFLRKKESDADCRILSMGMSGDYMTAIKHGSTMIRPGRILFGERNI